jgi:hypothetical protein
MAAHFFRRGLTVLLLAQLFACEPEAKGPPVKSAEFGIFFGGQLQEREEFPFQLDPAKQQQGFRVVFKEALSEPLKARWELSRPGPIRSRDFPLANPAGRVTQLHEGTVPRGARDFEQRFSFVPGDPLGLWNIRLTLGPHVAIDRPFTVYDADARRLAKRRARRPDAGR